MMSLTSIRIILTVIGVSVRVLLLVLSQDRLSAIARFVGRRLYLLMVRTPMKCMASIVVCMARKFYLKE